VKRAWSYCTSADTSVRHDVIIRVDPWYSNIEHLLKSSNEKRSIWPDSPERNPLPCFISKHQPIWAARTICSGFLAVASKSGMGGRQASGSVKMIGSSRRFGQAMNERHCTYGAPRGIRDLRDAGEGCSFRRGRCRWRVLRQRKVESPLFQTLASQCTEPEGSTVRQAVGEECARLALRLVLVRFNPLESARN